MLLHTISVHIKDDPILSSSRIFKITNSLVNQGVVSRCVIIGKWSKGLKEVDNASESRSIIRIKTPLQAFIAEGKLPDATFIRKLLALYSIFYFHVAILYKLFEIGNFKFLSIHSPEFFVLSKIYQIFKKIHLVYLPHELEPHKTGLKRMGRLLVGVIEKSFIRDAKSAVFVCQPILQWYKQTYGVKNAFVVRNVPYNENSPSKRQESNKFREEFFIPDNHIIFVYQGVIAESRGSDKILEVFCEAEKDKHIVMMGYGSLANKVMELSQRHANIHFKPAVPMDQIIAYTSSADIGIIFLFDKPSLSYQLSLPNKFSEYLIAGIPVVVSTHLKYMAGLIEEYRLGWALKPTKQELASLVNVMSKLHISNTKHTIHSYSENLSWHIEELELLKAYAG
jgi:hypothetical protein